MPSEVERLASVEARLAAIENLMSRMDAKLDALSGIYVTRQEVNEMARSRDEKIARLKEEIVELKNRLHQAEMAKKAIVPSWIQVAIAFIAMVIALWSKGLK